LAAVALAFLAENSVPTKWRLQRRAESRRFLVALDGSRRYGRIEGTGCRKETEQMGFEL